MTSITRAVIEAAVTNDFSIPPHRQRQLLDVLVSAEVPAVDHLIPESQAARLLSCSKMHLSRWRRGKTGSRQLFPFRLFQSGGGALRYDRRQVEQWMSGLAKSGGSTGA